VGFLVFYMKDKADQWWANLKFCILRSHSSYAIGLIPPAKLGGLNLLNWHSISWQLVLVLVRVEEASVT